MKLTHLSVHGFLGVRAVDVPLTTTVTLFAGANGAGKSSLRDAVTLALTADLGRVGLKKEAAQLITVGADCASIEVQTDAGMYGVAISASGRISDSLKGVETPASLPYVLDGQRFAQISPNDRRAFLFGLMGLSANGAEVRKRLLAKNLPEKFVEAVIPMLRAGFDAAHKAAQDKARDHKATWRVLTSETYGEKKAATWQAEVPEFDAAALVELKARCEDLDEAVAAANQRVGALQSNYQRGAEAAQRLEALRKKAAPRALLAEQLQADEVALQELVAKVQKVRDARLSQDALPCPECGSMLVTKDGELVHAGPLAKASEADIGALPDLERALARAELAVTGSKRYLAEAEAAAMSVTELEAAAGPAPSEDELRKAREDLATLRAERDTFENRLNALREVERQAHLAGEATNKARQAHEAVAAWSAIADALAPDGIPGEILGEALSPLNARLRQSAEIAEWPQVLINPDMSILIAGNKSGTFWRPYNLLSESEQWRVDAMVAEAIASLSGLRLLVLDRFDVLDLRGRGDLMAWLEAISGEIDTALIFGTLKALPAAMGPPEVFAAHWLESGTLSQHRAAA
ncbi:MAG TPA: AAA family ATPase [Dyella sp.]|nr:AAA family ATPase [Dyella sp.]